LFVFCIILTTQTGDSIIARDDVELPEGWKWEEDWQYDLNRAVDEYGWCKGEGAVNLVC
jgi:hypothetical protein